MNAIPPINTSHPTPDQWQTIGSLANTLAFDQAIWLSGYFAGLGQSLRSGADDHGVATFTPISPPVSGENEEKARTLTILYGSETGNGAGIARQMEIGARERGLDVRTSDMASYKVRDLRDEQDIVVVTSTHGEGDPPEPAMGFFEFILGRKAPRLEGVRYTVIGLGDSTYEFFCGAAQRLDERFAELGATRFHERLDCDVDYEDAAADWADVILGKFAEGAGEAKATAPDAIAAQPGAAREVSAHDKHNPFDAPVLDNVVLTGRGSGKETRHVEISLEGSSLAYEPGDALGFVPRNDPRLVETLLAETGLDAGASLATRTGEQPLAEALETSFEISQLTPRFVENWARRADAPALQTLLAPEKRSELMAFVRDNHVIDVLRDFPVSGLDATEFVGGLRPLQPRLYSIASSASATPGEAHLTVSTVRYHLRDEPRSGVASGFLAERLNDDDRLPVYIQSNPHFRLPADDDTPIIMVGAGTGVAPYRAFLQEREARGSEGRSWLLFGDRNFRTDFLYQTEWQGFLKDGVLTRMDIAFSRDQAEKIYVHHRLREQARQLYAWLEDGAHIYVCGDATALAPDVHRALIDIVAEESGLGVEKAGEFVRDLQRNGRYQRDVY